MTKKILAVLLALAMIFSMFTVNVFAADEVELETLFTKTIEDGYTGTWSTILPQAETAAFIEACEAEDSVVTITVPGVEFTWAQFILQSSEFGTGLQVDGGHTEGSVYTVSGAVVVESWNENKITEGTWYQICFQGTPIDPETSDLTIEVKAPKKEGSETPEGTKVSLSSNDPYNWAGAIMWEDIEASLKDIAPEALADIDSVEVAFTVTGAVVDGEVLPASKVGANLVLQGKWEGWHSVETAIATDGNYKITLKPSNYDLDKDGVKAYQIISQVYVDPDDLPNGMDGTKTAAVYYKDAKVTVNKKSAEDEPAAETEVYKVETLNKEELTGNIWGDGCAVDYKNGRAAFYEAVEKAAASTDGTGYIKIVLDGEFVNVKTQATYKKADGSDAYAGYADINPAKTDGNAYYISCADFIKAFTASVQAEIDAGNAVPETKLDSSSFNGMFINATGTLESISVVVVGGKADEPDKPSEDEPSEDEPEVPSDAKIPSGYKAIKTITGGKVTFPEDEYNKGSANGTLVTLVQSEYNLTEDDYIYFSITPSANLTKYKVAGQVQNTSWGSDWQGVTGGDNVNSVGFYLKDVLAINPSVPLAQLQQVLLQVWDGEIGDSVEDYTVVIARKSEEPSKPTVDVETEIEADVKNCSDELTIIKLPETVANGETIKLHVKGSSKGDFRMWLAGGQTTLCADPQWKASEQLDDYTAFDFTVELTCAPQNAGGAAGTADGILFKGPSYGVNLDGLTIDYIAIVTEVEVEQPTTKVEEVSYSMEKTGGDQFEDKSLAGGLNLEKDAEYGLCRIASSWVGGGSVYNAIIAALQSSDGGNLKITFTGDFEGLTFQADGIESTLAPEDFTITYVGNNNVASIPVADVLKAFAEGIAADSWKNIVLNYGDQLTLYAFEITTFKEVVIDEPTDTTDNTPFGYAIQTGNNKYHGFRIGPFMISMPHRFVNGICPICHQRAPKTTDVSSLIEADEDEAETVSEPAPAKPTYTASEDALYVLEKTSGQNFEDVTIAGGAELVTSDGRTRLATSWVGGGTVYNDLIKALQANEDAVIKITYTGTITAFGIESENAGIIDVECEVTEGDEFNTMTCNVADFLETAKKAIEDTSWRNVYLVAEDGAVLYGFEIVAAE